MLTLTEELMLLALNDEKGTAVVFVNDTLPQGLAGAMVLDLISEKKIAIKDEMINVIDRSASSDNVLDKALTIITDGDKVDNVLSKISGKIDDYKDFILDDLITNGILRKEKHKIMFLITTDRYPTSNSETEDKIRLGIRDVILNETTASERVFTQINLVKACELIDEIFEKSERKDAKKKIAEVCSDEYAKNNIEHSIAEATFVICKNIEKTNITSSSLAGL